MLDLIKVFGTTHPNTDDRMLEAGGATMFDQAVDLAHVPVPAAINTNGPSGNSARCVSPNGMSIRTIASRLQLLDQV